MKDGTSRGIAAIALVFALLPIAGCSDDDSSTDSSLSIALSADPGNLDPQRSVNEQNLLLSMVGYDTPVKLLSPGEVVPEVVTSWEAGNKSYVLTVREGVTCEDGTPMDAKTVADNINYVGNPDNGSPMTGVVVPPGAKATANPSDSTVTVKLAEDAPFFMENLGELPLVCAQGMKDRDMLADATSGSGPYVLSDAKPGVSYTFELRDDYTWGPDGANTEEMPKELTYTVVNNQATKANQLISGQLNVAQVSGSDTQRLEDAGLFSAGTPDLFSELVFNEAAGSPLADAEVRRALVSALDLEALAKIDTGGLGEPADGLIAPPKICSGDTMAGNIPEYDPSGAEDALAGTDISIRLVFSNQTPTNSATAQYIADQWTTLGVDVQLEQQSFEQTYATVFGKGDWDAALIALVVSNPATLVPFLSGPAPPDGNNFGSVDNPDYERLVQSASSKPGREGCDDWNAAEAALFRDADVAPISTAPFLYWGNGAEFDVEMSVSNLIPTSLRAVAED